MTTQVRREFADVERIPDSVSRNPAPIKVCRVCRFHHHPKDSVEKPTVRAFALGAMKP
jgi:hypothetical protein